MNICIVDPHRENSSTYTEIKKYVEGNYKVFGDSDDALHYLRSQPCDVIFIKHQLTDMKGSQLAGLLRKTQPEVSVFVYGEEASLDMWREVTAAKAYFIPLPIEPEKLRILVKENGERKKTAEKHVEDNNKEPEETMDELISADVIHSKPEEKPITQLPIQAGNLKDANVTRKKKRKEQDPDCTIITIFSPKGGVGKTTLTANLASLVQTELGEKTVILELTRQTGNILGHFRASPGVDVRHWLTHSLVNQDIEDNLCWCPVTEVAILPSIKIMEEDAFHFRIKPEHVTEILNVIKPHFDVVIIDGGTLFDDVLFHALECSDHGLMISKMERETLQDCHYVPFILEKKGIDSSKIIHVLNQVKRGLGISRSEALEMVNVERETVIHFDPAVERVPREKDPYICRRKRKGRFYRELWELASMVVEHPEFEEEEGVFLKLKQLF